jgi:hypothetical protein
MPSRGRVTLAAQAFARRLGAASAQGSDAGPPEPLDAAIIFAPVGALVPAALAAVRKGGTVVCGGIHMSDIPTFPYALLWGERRLVSVANLTRADAVDFLALAPRVGVRTEVEVFPLAEANEALARLREGRLTEWRCWCRDRPSAHRAFVTLYQGAWRLSASGPLRAAVDPAAAPTYHAPSPAHEVRHELHRPAAATRPPEPVPALWAGLAPGALREDGEVCGGRHQPRPRGQRGARRQGGGAAERGRGDQWR